MTDALSLIAAFPADGNSEPDVMAWALDCITTLAARLSRGEAVDLTYVSGKLASLADEEDENRREHIRADIAAAVSGLLDAPDARPVWIIERTGEPWVGDWIADPEGPAAYRTYPTRADAEERHLALGARWWLYMVRPEAVDGKPGFRVLHKA